MTNAENTSAAGDGASTTTRSDELVACPVHDCGLVCSGCENLCEHLKECHLPDCELNPSFLCCLLTRLDHVILTAL